MHVDNSTAPQTPAGDEGLAAPALPVIAAPRLLTGRRRGLPEWVGILLTDGLSVCGLIMLVLILAMAIFAPLLTPYAPGDMVALPSQPPSFDHWFGTNHQGQDIFSQVAFGARSSLFIGITSGLAITALSVVVGMTAGYIGGWIDDAIGVVTNVFLVIPTLPLLVVLAGYLPFKGVSTMIVVIALTGWAWGARVIRSQTLSLRGRDFVDAAVISGEATWRIIFSEIMPNMISLIVSTFIFAFTGALLADTSLEFLGFGDVNNISWGTTLYWAQTNSTLLTGEWWHFLFPGLAVALTTAACIFINNGIDVISNPRLRVIKAKAARTPSPRGEPATEAHAAR